MRKRISILLTGILLLFALAPWLISSCASHPLLPDQLAQAPVHYEATVDASQEATMEALRQEPSVHNVVTVGTVVVTPGPDGDGDNEAAANNPSQDASAEDTSAVNTPSARPVLETPKASPNDTSNGAADAEQLAETAKDDPLSEPPSEEDAPTEEQGSSVEVVSAIILTQTVTATPLKITVVSETTPVPASDTAVTVSDTMTNSTSTVQVVDTAVASESAPEASTSVASTIHVGTPITGTTIATQTQVLSVDMVETIEMFTEEMLTARVQEDTLGTDISDIIVRLTPDGVLATGSVPMLFGVERPFETRGQFVVENESLKFQVTSILVDSLDMTEQYRGVLEDSVNSSLYRLLPQRYIKSFQLTPGAVEVVSEMKQE